MLVKNSKLVLISNSEKIKDFKPDGRAKKLNGFLIFLYRECKHFTRIEDYEEFY